MTKVIVKNEENFEKAFKKFNRESSTIKREAKNREYFLTKKERRALKARKNHFKKFYPRKKK